MAALSLLDTPVPEVSAGSAVGVTMAMQAAGRAAGTAPGQLRANVIARELMHCARAMQLQDALEKPAPAHRRGLGAGLPAVACTARVPVHLQRQLHDQMIYYSIRRVIHRPTRLLPGLRLSERGWTAGTAGGQRFRRTS